MEKVGIILIVLFLTTIILGPLFCVTVSRNDKPKIYNPQPADLDRARQKLTSVTTCAGAGGRTNPPENADVEAAALQTGLGECLICIGPLIPEPAHTTGDGGTVTLEVAEVATITAKSMARSSCEQHEAAVELGTATQPAAATSNSGEEDVLTLNTCGHSFHSKCLSSWFLIERYDCPICRLPYYKSRALRTPRSLGVTPFY